MRKRAVSGMMLTLLCISVLAFSATTAQSIISRIGFGVYWNSSLSNPVFTIDWGTLQPGSGKNITIYVANEANVSFTLSMGTSNWNPPEAENFISLTWDYGGGILEPSSVVLLKLSLFISPDIEGVHAFFFDWTLSTIPINSSLVASESITASGSMRYLVGDISGDNTVDMNDMIIWADAFGSRPNDPSWNPLADLRPDNLVDIFDGILIAVNFGKTWPPISYFLFQDPEFSYDQGSPRTKWNGSTWNFTSDFRGYFNIRNGLATLSYNESSGDEWGGTVLVQGTLPHSWGGWLWPLEGETETDAKQVEYVVFDCEHPILQDRFLLGIKVMVSERNYTVLGSYGEAVSNVGVDLMFGIDSADYYDKNESHCVAIHVDTILSRAYWDSETKTLHHDSPPVSVSSPSPYDADYHLTLIRGQMTQLQTWYTFEIDLAEIINTIFTLTGKEIIRYYGAQVYADGIGSRTTAIFDYVNTRVQE